MKFIKLFPFILFIINIVFVSCNNDDVGDITSSEPDTVLASWDTLVASSFIEDKYWKPLRVRSFAYMIGPQTEDWNWNSPEAPYFSWGAESSSDVLLSDWSSLADDLYDFSDGDFRITFFNDFWGNEIIWENTSFQGTSINIVNDTLPKTNDGDNVNSYIRNNWRYQVDDRLRQLTIFGAGGHIIDPRIKNSTTSIVPVSQTTYDIVHMATGDYADTLVLSIDTYDQYFDQDIRVFYKLARYKFDTPSLLPPDSFNIESIYFENMSYDTLGDLSSGENIVFQYTKEKEGLEIITDDGYEDVLVFAIPNHLENFHLTDDNLKEAKPILVRNCFCGYHFYEIHDGYIKGNINSDQSYTIEFDIVLKGFDHSQAYHLYDKRIFEQAP